MPDNDFGYTVWGRDWVRLAEPLRQTRPDPRLPRARRMARDEKVRVTLDGRTVRADVRHGRKPSTATIEVAPMSREAAAGISRHLSGGGQPALTDELYREITAAGHPPAPTLITADCSCSGAGAGLILAEAPRCIHVLAVFYEMARRVDDDPRVALDIQGFFRAAPDGGGGDTGTKGSKCTAVSTTESTTASPAASNAVRPQRWIAFNTLDPADYFTVAE
ncbi:hypothetical protein ABZ953_07640 [Streptomyces sp. NPDC046465]|uniref:hypothetical protein n=1 Tax=Streptomyces sp. NPDC046465 TaxID=3155810 RepID=UPI0033C72F09